MFNLSATNNSGYNGISQLSESQTDFPNRIVANSKVKLHSYMNSDSKNSFSADLRNLSYDRSKANLVSQLKQTSKEDVYTFHDSDQTFIHTKLNSPDFDSKRTPTSVLPVAARRVQIVKPLNGFVKDVDAPEPHNGEAKRGVAKSAQSKVWPLCSKITVKQSKDLVGPLSSDFKIASDNGLNNPTKNSINNSIVSSIISNCAYQSRKSSSEGSIKQESNLRKVDKISLSNYLNDVAIKTTAKKIPSGKPNPTAFKLKKGRGPAVHEALQRITPFSTMNTPKGSSGSRWHSPSSDLFDCGAIDSYPYLADSDSDSSDDSMYDYVNNSWFDCNSKSEDRSKRILNSTTSLRRRINELQRLQSIINLPKSTSELYQAMKKQQRRGSFGNEFRLEGPALEMLLNSRSTDSILSSSDKRRIRNGKRPVEPIGCAHPGCKAPSLACARLCLAHISLNPEQKLFSECIAKSSDHVQCRAPVANVRNEQPLCPKHMLKKDNPSKISPDSKSNQSSRKRHKPSAVIRPQNRDINGADILHTSINNNFDTFEKTISFNGIAQNTQLFSPNSIVNGITSTYLNNDDNTELNVCSNSSYESSEDAGIGSLTETELISASNHVQQIVDADVVADVLAMHELPLELPPPDPPQEANIDLSTVFNDFFAEHNEGYIPTREETEELERALEAVNQDVKSLEKLTSSQHSSLLDSFLDEKVLAETLASLPDVFSSIPPVKVTSDHIVEPSSSMS